MKTENLIKATHSASFLDDEIRAAFRDANANGDECACILLMGLIQPACDLRRKLDSILAAVKLDNAG